MLEIHFRLERAVLISPKNYHILPSNCRRSMEISFSEWMNNFEAGEKGAEKIEKQ